MLLVAAATILPSPVAMPAPVSTSEPHSVGVLREGQPYALKPNSTVEKRFSIPDAEIDVRSLATRTDDSVYLSKDAGTKEIAGPLISVTDLLHPKVFELSALDENNKINTSSSACAYPESYLRTLIEGKNDCNIMKPGAGELQFFTLPFLVLSGWVLVVLTIAGLPRLYRNWRVRRWLRRVAPPGGRKQPAAPRAVPRRPAARSSSRRTSRSRRYAG
jgi:hypothetical protein